MQLFYSPIHVIARLPQGGDGNPSVFRLFPAVFCSFPTILATNIMTAKHFFSRKSYFYIKVCIFAYTKKQKG